MVFPKAREAGHRYVSARLCFFSLFGLFSIIAEAAAPTPSTAARSLYAVNQSGANRGSISIYDIDAGHRLAKTIKTVPNVGDIRGVAVSAVTGKLYVAYLDVSGDGMVYCLNVYDDTILWNRAVSPGVDRLAVNPDGQLLYVPTWEGGTADFINVLDANTGDVFERCISQTDRTILNTHYPGRSSRRRRPATEAAITYI